MMRRLAFGLLLLLLAGLPALRARAGEDDDYRRAHHLYTLQEYKLASEALTKYLATYPASERATSARLLLAESFYQLKEYAQAGQQFEKYLSDNPASPRRAEAEQRAVKVFYLARDTAKDPAQECLKKSVAWADTFLKENRPRLGKADTPAALAAQFESVLYYGGESSYQLKNAPRAREFWDALLREFPQTRLAPDACEGLGWLAFEAGDFPEAQRRFTVTAGAPGHPKAAGGQLMLARTLDKQGQTDAALAALDKVPGLSGGKEQAPYAALWRALILLQARRYTPAVEAWRALIRDYASLPEAGDELAKAAERLQAEAQFPGACVLADLYLASFPKGAERARAARVKAGALAGLKQTSEAQAAARVALQEADALPPADPRRAYERPAALLLLAQLSGAEGKAQYEAILREHNDSPLAPAALYQLAYWAGQAGQFDAALGHLAALLQRLRPDDPETAALRRQGLFAAADFAFRKPDYEAAEKYLKEYLALKDLPADPAAAQLALVKLRLGWCRYKAKDPTGAVTSVDQALTANPAPELRQEMLYLRGRARLGLQPAPALDLALADFAQAVKEVPAGLFAAHAGYDAAEALYAAERCADALPWLDAFLNDPARTELPFRTDALLLRAKARYRAGKPVEALTDTEALLVRPDFAAQPGRVPTVRLLKALCLDALPGRAADAEAAYGALIDGGPADSLDVRQGLLRRAQLRFQAKRFEQSQADLTVLVGDKEPQAGQPAQIEAALLLALCRKELKDPAGARTRLEALSRLPLTGALAFEVPFQLGNLTYEAAQYAEAAKLYRRALDAAASTKGLTKDALAPAWLNLAWSLQRGGQPQDAEAAFGKLTELDPLGPYSAEARHERAQLLAELGQLEPALTCWRELLEKQAESPAAEKAQLALAGALAKAGRFPEALQAFERYLAKYPQGGFVREAWCGLGECRLSTKDSDAAQAAFQKALGEKGAEGELDETSERAVLGLAELAQRRNNPAECKKLALRVVLDRPESKWLDGALFFCAKVSEEMGEPDKAIGYYRKLLADRPQSARAAAARERLKALGAPDEKEVPKP